MKEIKEKPTERAPKSDSAGKIPKAALKKAWTETKEKSRAKLRESTSAQGDGDYTTANDTGGMVTDTSHSAIQQNTDFTVQQSRKFARKQIEKYRERHTAEQVETSRAYTAGERGVGPKQARRGTLPDAEPRPHRGADLPHQRAKEKVDTAKTAPRDIRGVTQGQRQLRTAANETVRNVTTQAQVQTRTRQVQLAMQKAAANTRKTATAVRSAIRHFLASLRSLVTAIVTGISVALSIIIVISLVAFVSGSAYGIFFAANAPNENAISVQEALETLTGEYRDRLEEISNTIQHDRQDIVANDGVYFIRWQDVLAVFSSYVSGDEFGSSVASLEEEQVDKLREIMWEINNIDRSISNQLVAPFHATAAGIGSTYFEKRIYELVTKICARIIDSAGRRIPYICGHAEYMQLCEEICRNISPSQYTPDYESFRQAFVQSDLTEEMLQSRECRQLRYCNLTTTEISDHLSYEQYYENIRQHYLRDAQKEKILSTERIANQNHKDVVLELQADGRDKPSLRLVKTKRAGISTMPNEFSRWGAYIFLTKDKLPNQISWKDENGESDE